MVDKVYNLVEVVGSSQDSIEDAIDNAIKKVAETQAKVDWFEVIETRGFIEQDHVKYYQVHLKVGCNF